ncbi:hypothetical protein DSL72_008084 [Monilinia vaccinii-corymbosi]|uniref:Uncharacterized protein n=1 Tax=Monilinia vaccinii-corymbosi TaxID=61207 RepID=A0A8A3PIQ3_9HELO|nr:hypothetical protein DSL72_008084 [Monilinia vaccinii-corymbosi]
MSGKQLLKAGRKWDFPAIMLTYLLVRFANIYHLASARYEELLATGQTLEVLEAQLRRELKTYPHLRANPAQICKSILGLVREARILERATASSLLPTPKPSISPPPPPPPAAKVRAKPALVSRKIVVLRLENGCFTPKSVLMHDDTGLSPAVGPAKIVWSIKKRIRGANHAPAVEVATTRAPKTVVSPAVISPITLEYMGTNLTEDQLYYNSLARRVDTKSIIAARIKRGIQQLQEGLEEATMRAHSWAECEVAMLAGHLAEKAREEEELSGPVGKRKRVGVE